MLVAVYWISFVHAICKVLYLLHVPFAELLLPLAWIGHEFYGHAIQYAYMADSVFLFVFVWLILFSYLLSLALPFGLGMQLQYM